MFFFTIWYLLYARLSFPTPTTFDAFTFVIYEVTLI